MNEMTKENADIITKEITTRPTRSDYRKKQNKRKRK